MAESPRVDLHILDVQFPFRHSGIRDMALCYTGPIFWLSSVPIDYRDEKSKTCSAILPDGNQCGGWRTRERCYWHCRMAERILPEHAIRDDYWGDVAYLLRLTRRDSIDSSLETEINLTKLVFDYYVQLERREGRILWRELSPAMMAAALKKKIAHEYSQMASAFPEGYSSEILSPGMDISGKVMFTLGDRHPWNLLAPEQYPARIGEPMCLTVAWCYRDCGTAEGVLSNLETFWAQYRDIYDRLATRPEIWREGEQRVVSKNNLVELFDRAITNWEYAPGGPEALKAQKDFENIKYYSSG